MSSRWDGANRRKFPRVKYAYLVVIYNPVEKENNVILTHTENLGIGGVCVILQQDIKIFSQVELELDLLDLNEHIKCKGKIVWNVHRKASSNKGSLCYDIGIEFLDLKEGQEGRLEEVVQKLVQRFANEIPYT